ncbi:hypothetical protein LCGC14_0386860 [marine sediment metagenome]|uniref:DNA methylase N-4/N-6 domain-containing protein n=1 Tax=marine sediment metagenome TaxID=412755 RepID=A0A0F9W9N3_9ZZZZ
MADITWANVQVQLGDLQPWPRNPRHIRKDQAQRLADSFDTFGQVETIAIGPDNEVYNGHQRLNVLRQQHGPDYVIDARQSSRTLTEKEREQLVIYLHKGTTGEWDFELLANEFEVEELLEWGFEDWELGLDGEETEAGEDTEPQIDRAEELREKWGVQAGQLWQLGEHRLICGDCTDVDVVARVLESEIIDCVVTDPPYGVSYDGGTTTREKLSGDELPVLYYPALDCWQSFCAEHVALYLWYADGDQAVVQAVVQAGWQVRRNLIWNKNLAQYGALSQQYKQKHEPFLYCHLQGHAPYWAGDATEITVWDIDRESVNELHPTQKPPALFERAITNSSKKGDIVFDGFLGSGTCVIACQNLGRKCRAIEISPAYVGVCLQRFVDHTGIVPVLVDILDA